MVRVFIDCRHMLGTLQTTYVLTPQFLDSGLGPRLAHPTHVQALALRRFLFGRANHRVGLWLLWFLQFFPAHDRGTHVVLAWHRWRCCANVRGPDARPTLPYRRYRFARRS